jgi:hypothetical protein
MTPRVRLASVGSSGVDCSRGFVDPFPLIVIGGIAVVVGLLVLLARLYPGTGADLLDWGPARSIEHEVELEMQDVDQMIEAQNAYRRKRGERELTEDEIRENVAREEVRRLSDSP